MINRILLVLLIAIIASSQISYNPTTIFEGAPASTTGGQPALVGKTSTTGNLSYLKVDENGGLVTTALTGFGADFSFGDVTSASLSIKVVRRTAYTEPGSNAVRSFSSSIDSDSAAGTGARTIQISFMNAAYGAIQSEVLTLNGTTCVATVSNEIAYIEDLQTLTGGSGGTNAGVITLFNNNTCGGGTIGTIGIGDGQAFWAHHYIALGKVANVTGISVSHNGTTVGSGGVFIMRSKQLTVANSREIQVSDFVRLYGQSSTFARSYTSPLKVNGPARLDLFVTPETATSTVYRGSIDFFEP